MFTFSSVTSDGTTGRVWIERLKAKKYVLSEYAKRLLLSPDFKPTKGVLYPAQVLDGMLFGVDHPSTKEICSKAKERNLGVPNAEMACLLREKLSDAEIRAAGLIWIVVMHKPITDHLGESNLLSLFCSRKGPCLDAYCGSPLYRWGKNTGFAFKGRGNGQEEVVVQR